MHRRPVCRWLLVALAGLFLACEVTPEKIEHWKGIEGGPRKLRDAVKDDGLKTEVRVAAAVALVDLALSDDLVAEVKELKPASKTAILEALVPRLIQTAKGSDPAAPPSRKQRNAKDALFLLRGHVQAPMRKTIDQALVAWVTADLTGRQTAGAHSSTKILRAIGAPAGPSLAALLKAPGPDFDAAARLLGELGDAATRTKAGEWLVELARKEKPIRDSTLEALGRVGGATVVKYLGEVVAKGRESEEEARRALIALQLSPRPESLDLALRTAKDRKQPEAVRHEAVALARRVGGKAAAEGVAAIMSDPDTMLGWHAFEAVLAAHKGQGIPLAFSGLTMRHLAKKDDLADFLVRHVKDLGGPKMSEHLHQQLESKNPAARLAAVVCLAELGTAADAGAVGTLTGDKTRIKGWSKGSTIGTEARAAVERLKKKR